MWPRYLQEPSTLIKAFTVTETRGFILNLPGLKYNLEALSSSNLSPNFIEKLSHSRINSFTPEAVGETKTVWI